MLTSGWEFWVLADLSSLSVLVLPYDLLLFRHFPKVLIWFLHSVTTKCLVRPQTNGASLNFCQGKPPQADPQAIESQTSLNAFVYYWYFNICCMTNRSKNEYISQVKWSCLYESNFSVVNKKKLKDLSTKTSPVVGSFWLSEKAYFIKTSTKIDNTVNNNSMKAASVLQKERRPKMEREFLIY